jgi:PAS domain S-box-containing protein
MSFSDTLAKAVLSTSSDAVIAADKEGIIRFWNPGAERILGYARDVAVGQSLDIIIPERLRKRHWDGYHGVMKSGESRYGHGDVLAVPAIKKDGVEVSIEFTIVPLRDGAGELTGLVAILRDVTKRFEEMRALKRKLAEATKLSRCGEHDGVERTLHTAVQDRSSAEQACAHLTKARGAGGNDSRRCARFQESSGGNRLGSEAGRKEFGRFREIVRLYRCGEAGNQSRSKVDFPALGFCEAARTRGTCSRRE